MHSNLKRIFAFSLIAAGVALGSVHLQRLFAPPVYATASFTQRLDSADGLRAFAALDPVDTHVHAFKSNSEISDLMARLRLHVLDICVADSHGIYGPLDAQLARAKSFVLGNLNHAKLCITFDPSGFQKKDFTNKTIAQLHGEFADGAIAVKIWKNIGMELKTPEGRYVMPDDPVFEPIYRAIAAKDKTLIAHVAEPSSSWQAPNPKSPDYDYYKENPQWYMYLHPDRPSKQVILAARDHLLAENPKLRVVGAHLGSMETDVNEIAKRLDRYPNFAIDTAARMEYLMMQPKEKVREFLMKYQDRVLYATDLEFLNDEPSSEAIKDWQATYTRDWRFLATGETLQIKDRHIQGLHLPAEVLRRIYHDNAVRWFPGILQASE